MVDPFFKKNNDDSHESNIVKDTNTGIQTLMWQQQEIQEKYKELKELYTNDQLDADQKEEIAEQMQKLSTLYSENKATIAMLTSDISWEKEIHTNKNIEVKTEKNEKKLSLWKIALWCSTIFILLIWWLAIIFYFLMRNPNSLSSLWINQTTAAQLLQIFSVLFFWLLFIASLSILILNFYRLVTTKNKRKIWYIWWILLWFIILIVTLISWAKVLSYLKDIDPNNLLNSNDIISAYLVTADWTQKIWSDEKLFLIAPANIVYTLNSNWNILNKFLQTNLWNVKAKSAVINCWNWWWKVNISTNNGMCFYPKKWTYPISLDVWYINLQTNEERTTTLSLWSINIISDISITSNQTSVKFSNNEIIVGKNPVKVTYDASSVFVDLQLSDYNIEWNWNWDNQIDRINYSSYTHVYTWAWVYNVFVKFPWLNDYRYSFPIRIEQSDVPIAEISYSLIDANQYNIIATFLEKDPDISEYVFKILDKKNNKTIDTITSKTPAITYTFPWDWKYAIELTFATQEWKQWTAESEDIEIWWTQYKISYDVYTKTPTTPSFSIQSNKDNIIIKELPTILKIDITKITPSTETTSVKVFVNGSPIVSTNNTFETTLDEQKDYTINIIISDPNHDITTQKVINVSVNRDDIVPELRISPDTVGTSPFTVKFDASTTTVHDSDDEIVYFSRDFGDWNHETNISQSIISHTYSYDYENENWTFYPSVTLKTKKWREILITWNSILVKKPSEIINIELISHPAQTASAWDNVEMKINVNGTPSTVIWDFWDGKTHECKERNCLNITHIFEEKWNYNISVKVSYPDRPTIEWTINLIVRNK